MARCEDYPCCGHELGCCPDFDEDTGQQLNMKCVCGATVPLSSSYSICSGCLNAPDSERFEDSDSHAYYPEPDDYEQPDDDYDD